VRAKRHRVKKKFQNGALLAGENRRITSRLSQYAWRPSSPGLNNA
jgi:hypothetical protein